MRDYEILRKALMDAWRGQYCSDCELNSLCQDDDSNCWFKQAADAIEELLAELTTIRKQLPRWISVEEPPNDERNVFICHGNADFKAPCIGHYDASMKRFYEDKNWFASPIYDAMFWCEMPKLPLPTPPKGVE